MKLFAIPTILIIVSTALIAMNAGAPRMVTESWEASVRYRDSQSYFSECERNRTIESKRYDVGVGLMSFGASLLALLLITRLWSVERLRTLNTPKRRWPVFAAANLVWIYYNWATWQFLIVQQRRHEFPPWADSIVIGLMGITLFAIVGGIVMNIGLLSCLYKAKLPVPLWVKPHTRIAWALNAGIAFALAMCAWAAIDAVVGGDAYTPPAVVAIVSLLLVGRAGASAA